jgi:hypothetical protein
VKRYLSRCVDGGSGSDLLEIFEEDGAVYGEDCLFLQRVALLEAIVAKDCSRYGVD